VYRGWEELEKRAYAQARRIFVSSKFAADSLVEDYGIGAEGVVVVGSGSNVKPPVEVGPRGGGRILFVGVEWERKGGPQLLRAFEQLRAKYPQVELDVVGCEGTHGAAKFHGRMAADRVRQFYERADIFCLPSLAEPSASVLAEAAAFALPIVGTRVGGTPERVIDGETGWLVEPGAVEPLALALERLVAHPAAARAMGDRGRALALEHFTWAAVAKKIRSGISQSLRR
jgi:glycosyltransferase involved in cell wall biosynthesis